MGAVTAWPLFVGVGEALGEAVTDGLGEGETDGDVLAGGVVATTGGAVAELSAQAGLGVALADADAPHEDRTVADGLADGRGLPVATVPADVGAGTRFV